MLKRSTKVMKSTKLVTLLTCGCLVVLGAALVAYFVVEFERWPFFMKRFVGAFNAIEYGLICCGAGAILAAMIAIPAVLQEQSFQIQGAKIFVIFVILVTATFTLFYWIMLTLFWAIAERDVMRSIQRTLDDGALIDFLQQKGGCCQAMKRASSALPALECSAMLILTLAVLIITAEMLRRFHKERCKSVGVKYYFEPEVTYTSKNYHPPTFVPSLQIEPYDPKTDAPISCSKKPEPVQMDVPIKKRIATEDAYDEISLYEPTIFVSTNEPVLTLTINDPLVEIRIEVTE